MLLICAACAGLLLTPVAAQTGATRGASGSQQRVFHLEGKVISVDKNRREIVVDHGVIRGLMGAMTMWYPVAVQDAKSLGGVAAGDEVTANVVVGENGEERLSHIVVVKKGTAPAAPPSVSLACQILANPGAYNGKMVEVRGSFRRTTKWNAIESRDCEGEILLVPPTDASVRPPAEFQIRDDQSFRSFRSYSEELLGGDTSRSYIANKRYKYEVEATFVGRIDSADVILASGKAQALPGFGPRGEFRARLVLKSVSDVVANQRGM